MSDPRTTADLPIALSATAAREVARRLSDGGLPAAGGLRCAVKGGGCSGFSYVVDLAAGPRPGDLVFESEGARVFVDPRSHQFLKGLRIDFNPGIHKHGFQFENPNAAKSCGCGSSFSVGS